MSTVQVKSDSKQDNSTAPAQQKQSLVESKEGKEGNSDRDYLKEEAAAAPKVNAKNLKEEDLTSEIPEEDIDKLFHGADKKRQEEKDKKKLEKYPSTEPINRKSIPSLFNPQNTISYKKDLKTETDIVSARNDI